MYVITIICIPILKKILWIISLISIKLTFTKHRKFNLDDWTLKFLQSFVVYDTISHILLQTILKLWHKYFITVNYTLL